MTANMPTIKGFTVNAAQAWWVTCDRCGEDHLVYGSLAPADALAWAEDHHAEVHGRAT